MSVGNKGGGRKSNANEALRLRVLDKCWVFLEQQMDDENTPVAVKREIALKLAPKSIPTELAGNVGVELTAMGTIEKVVDGVSTILKYDIGSTFEAEPT